MTPPLHKLGFRIAAFGCAVVAACGGSAFTSQAAPDDGAGNGGTTPGGGAHTSGGSKPTTGGATAGQASAAGGGTPSNMNGGAIAVGGTTNMGGAMDAGGAAAAAGATESGGGGDGGAGNQPLTCGTLPSKKTWVGTAAYTSPGYPASLAFDDDLATNYLSQAKQIGVEWLQVDFGQTVTLSTVTLYTGHEEYTRGYRLTMSGTSLDFAADSIASGAGKLGPTTIELPQRVAGRYLIIYQTGMTTSAWWAIDEISVACK